MARKGGSDRGVVFKNGSWWARLYANGIEKWYKADNKSQAKAIYGRIRAEIREGLKYFPEKFEPQKAISLRMWIDRYREELHREVFAICTSTENFGPGSLVNSCSARFHQMDYARSKRKCLLVKTVRR